jgi:hypothetical protein
MKLPAFIIVFFFCVSCRQKVIYPVGGFHYPKHASLSDSGFYFLPYKDSLSSIDSLKAVDEFRYSYAVLGEKNLSIQPSVKPTYRLTFEEWTQPITVIILTQDDLIIKRGDKHFISPYYDMGRLTEIERSLYDFIERYFPIEESKIKKPKMAAFFNAMLKQYPRLNDLNYFKELRAKCLTFPGEMSNKYFVIKRKISEKEFDRLSRLINESGFWQMPFDSDCKDIPSDAAGFVLEANTPVSYKVVTSASCLDDLRPFTKACHELVKSAGLQNEIRLIWEGAVQNADSADVSSEPLPLQKIN